MNMRASGSMAGVSEELMLRDKSTGRWLKRVDEDFILSKNLVPSSFITVNNNLINYTDTNKIIQKIVQERKESRTVFLEDRFNRIIDSLDNYRAYGSGIEKVFDACENHASEFDNRIRALVGEFDYGFTYNNENSNLLNVSSAYLKVLFSYIFSSFVLHKSKVKNETVIYTKLESFKSYLQSVLERILIPYNYGNQLDYSESMYSNMIFGDLDIQYVTKLVQFDKRFDDELTLIKSHSVRLVSDSYSYQTDIRGSYKKIRESDEKFKYVSELYDLLCDIDRLILIREEIHSISDETIFLEYEAHLHNG
ncbi:TPA: hypothetical protein ACGUMO_004561 [Vibrio vulnificus]|uniref:hypothetical protein n=1 Tax=Vibrio vulnificus TaxID=672 RepID=UPI001EEB18CC|nr:hypothetical protein [Vibrio vulnificus]MCG6289443.1 hypothetical protein [Vibrio vulnificus]HDY8002509.1 hypothetical protein [Vibrio vulnificus]